MSGANRPAGPATPKSRQLADQISRDEMERHLPDALWGPDQDGHSGDGSPSSAPDRGARVNRNARRASKASSSC